MKKIIAIAVIALMSIAFISSCQKNQKPEETSSKDKAKLLPQFSLADPDGKIHKSDEIVKGGLVLVVTAPTLSNKAAQEGWNRYLTRAVKGTKAQLVFLEDMQPSDFKKAALRDMKKDFEPGVPPLLLIDEKGDVREMLGVEKGKTAVLVYNKKGELIFTDYDRPNAGGSRIIRRRLNK